MEYSSGCESGWTMYLDQSLEEPSSFSARTGHLAAKNVSEVDEEEDLSMVSDASSGPPMFHEEEEEVDYYNNENHGHPFPVNSSVSLARKTDKKRKIQRSAREKHASLMDDTASSHAVNFPKTSFGFTNENALVEQNVVDFSMGFSITQYKGESAFEDHYSHLQMPLPGKATPAKPVCKKESRRNKMW